MGKKKKFNDKEICLMRKSCEQKYREKSIDHTRGTYCHEEVSSHGIVQPGLDSTDPDTACIWKPTRLRHNMISKSHVNEPNCEA